MAEILSLQDFMDSDKSDQMFEEESQLPEIEEIIDDAEALKVLAEDAEIVLRSGLSHRRLLVRLKSVIYLAQMFPNQQTFTAFQILLSDRREKREVRFHVARYMESLIAERQTDVLSMIQEFSSSKGCNDRIVAAILMGHLKTTSLTFDLLRFLQDSNDCVKIAALLSLLKFRHRALLTPVLGFIAKASLFELRLLEKNLHYYVDSVNFVEVEEALLLALASLCGTDIQIQNQDFSQQKLSKLDRYLLEENQEEDLSFFEM